MALPTAAVGQPGAARHPRPPRGSLCVSLGVWLLSCGIGRRLQPRPAPGYGGDGRSRGCASSVPSLGAAEVPEGWCRGWALCARLPDPARRPVGKPCNAVSGVTAHSPGSPSTFQSRLHMLVAVLPQGLLASPPAARLAGMAGQCGGGGMWVPPSLVLLGIPAVEGWVSGPPVWLDQLPSPTVPEPLVGPRQEPCRHLGSGCWQRESQKAMCGGYISSFFFSLKCIAECQQGLGAFYSLGSSFATLRRDVTGSMGPKRCQAEEHGDEPDTRSPTFCPNHLKQKWSRNTPQHVRFGRVIAVINPLPPHQPTLGAQPLGACGNKAPGRSRAGAACPSPCPQMPSRPGSWRQQFARRPGTPCVAEMSFVLSRCMAGTASCRCFAAPPFRCRGSAFPSPWM